MSHTNLTLGSNWDKGEWPDYVFVTHGAYDGARYVPERTCRNIHPDVFQCSECYSIDDDWKNPPYCHGCGAKVIE